MSEYKNSEVLLAKITQSENILLQAHQGPDGDSIGSVLAWHEVLTKQLNKKVKIICPTKLNASNFKLFPNCAELIYDETDYSNFDFSKFDLFLLNDTASALQLANDSEFKITNEIDVFVIDHHVSNSYEHYDRILDTEVFSNAHIVFNIFNQLDFKINETIATNLLTGVITDSAVFGITKLDSHFFNVISELIQLGGNYELIIERIKFGRSIEETITFGEMLRKIKVINGKSIKFGYIAVDFETLSGYSIDAKIIKDMMKNQIHTLEDLDFGLIIFELEPNLISVSFRSKDFDVNPIASKFNGGGHKNAAGAKLRGDFEAEKERLIEYCKEL